MGLKKAVYEDELLRLQTELIKLQGGCTRRVPPPVVPRGP